MTILYIAGPMTGITDYNYPAFNEAAAQLRDAGYQVLNPVDGGAHHNAPRPAVPLQGGDWADYMRNALNQVIRADGIALLPGWQGSKGARIEQQLALDLGMPRETLGWWLDSARLRQVHAAVITEGRN